MKKIYYIVILVNQFLKWMIEGSVVIYKLIYSSYHPLHVGLGWSLFPWFQCQLSIPCYNFIHAFFLMLSTIELFTLFTHCTLTIVGDLKKDIVMKDFVRFVLMRFIKISNFYLKILMIKIVYWDARKWLTLRIKVNRGSS